MLLSGGMRFLTGLVFDSDEQRPAPLWRFCDFGGIHHTYHDLLSSAVSHSRPFIRGLTALDWSTHSASQH